MLTINKYNTNILDLKKNTIIDNKLNKTQIYSSVLQIPNKFTVVNNGAASSGSNSISFTLKAGSVLTNANGTIYTVNSDEDFTLAPGQIACLNTSNGNVAGTRIDNCFSGTTAPASATTNAFWLDTANKQVKRKTSSGTWTTTYTLPFLFFDYNGKIKLFNSFGFIGSSVFSLPGLKTLHPDGKNADGTLNNFVHETTTVQITGNPYGILPSGKGRVVINSQGNLGVIYRYVESKEEPTTTYTSWFNPETNEMKYTGATAQNWQVSHNCIIGKPYYTYSSGITTFYDVDIYTPFIAANYYKTAEKDKVLNKTQITNCILEEPDNTIYEYDDSSFTFKAGSIAIFPYGTSAPAKSIGDDLFNNGQWIITDIQYDSGKLFYWARKQNDLNLTSWSASAQSGDFMVCYGQNNSIYSPSNNYSGTSIPEGAVSGMFYNTNDNRVYRIYNGSIEEYQSNYYSLPFMILHFDNSVVPKSVKQLFKGQSYIGGTRWLDKGVKLLFPNGRNSDGTLNNIEVENTKLLCLNLNNTSGYTTDYEAYLTCSYNNSNGNTVLNIGYITADRYFETDNLDEIQQEERNAIVYRPSFNDFWWYNASEDKWYERIYCITGEMYYNYSSASKILEFKPRNTFRAVDDFDLTLKSSKIFKSPKVQSYGIIKYGSPTLSNNILSNFSQTNYVRTNTLFYPDTTTWEMNFLITTGSNVSSIQVFCSSDYNILEIGISNDKHFFIEINGGSWVKGTYTVLANTTYYVKVKYTGTQYILSYSLNGSSYTSDITYNMTTPLDLENRNPFIYYGKDYNHNTEIFSGTINLTGCNIIVDDYLIWQGVRDYNNTEYPTKNRPAVVVQAFVNGTSGYRVWSDRYCEQWGYAESVNKSATITLPLAMLTSNYNITCTGTEAQGGGDNGSMNAYNVSATGFSIYNTSDVVSNAYWRVFGYRK